MEPLVTVSILNYLRRDALERVLRSLLVQNYPSLEVIVVDNGSGEETTSYIRQAFPQVRLLELPENLGASARNAGIRAARGEIIVTLDNDVYLDSPFEVRHIVSAFERHRSAGCIVFRIYHPETGRLHTRDWCHPRPWQEAEGEEFETHYLTEGAAAFRREVFDRVEPYWDALFIGHEGSDLGIRLLDAGYEIWYVPGVKVWHIASAATRQSWRPYYFNTRNLFWDLCRNYPWVDAVIHLVPRLGVLAFYAARHGFVRYFAKAVLDGLRGIHHVQRLRRPVGRNTLKRIAALRRSQPSVVARFVRHWHKPEF